MKGFVGGLVLLITKSLLLTLLLSLYLPTNQNLITKKEPVKLVGSVSNMNDSFESKHKRTE
jgi:hypothetical protein